MKTLIRTARFADIPALLRLFEEMREASIYSEISSVDEPSARQLLLQVIGGHGSPQTRSTRLVVAVKDGELVGLLIGVIVPFYEISSMLLVTDYGWYVRPGTGANVALELLDAFHEWADDLPGVKIYRHAITDTIGPAEPKARYLRQKRGFQCAGYVMERMST